jgi:hypothetical protein
MKFQRHSLDATVSRRVATATLAATAVSLFNIGSGRAASAKFRY